VRTLSRLCLGAFGMGVLLVAARAAADTYAVNSPIDAIDVVPGDGSCATATGACTLRAAVQEANAHAGPDVVTLPEGLFLLTLAGAGEDAAATGDLDVIDPLEIDGAGRETTLVDGLGVDRVLHSFASALTLRDMTVRSGFVTGPGGGLYETTGTVAIERVRFERNVATTGGALWHDDGALTISDGVFHANVASGGDGGALGFNGTGNLVVTNTEFTTNGSLGGGAGALASASTGAVTLTSCTFSSNFATLTGAVAAVGSTTFSLDGCLFDRNRSTAGGGALLGTGPGSVTVSRTQVLANLGGAYGGAYLKAIGTVQVTGSEFSDNVGLTGFGGLSVSAGAAGATVMDTVLRRNDGGSGFGGGLSAGAAGGTVTLTDVEASDNSSGMGGGLFLGGTNATLTRVRLLRNGSGTGPGGGAYITGTMVGMTDSTIEGNIAANRGGGISAIGAGLTITIANSTISTNRAASSSGQGGGVFLGPGFASTLSNVTFSGNVADFSGGGAYLVGTFTFRNVTLADNSAPHGSAILNDNSPITLASSIISGAAANHCTGDPIMSGDFNVDSNGTCGLSGAHDRNDVDPQLGPLADNGGPTLTHLPAAASAAIDGGDPNDCPATDQRGQVRPTDGNGDGVPVCDVGAVEFLDLCPSDPSKTAPGTCGCGVPDTDAALPNGVADCLVNAELKARIARARAIVAALTGDASEEALESELTSIAEGLGAYLKQFKAQLVLADPKAKVDKLAKKVRKAAKKATKAKGGRKLAKAKAKATTALDRLDRAIAPQ